MIMYLVKFITINVSFLFMNYFCVLFIFLLFKLHIATVIVFEYLVYAHLLFLTLYKAMNKIYDI